MSHTVKYYGPPGCGKSHKLLSLVEEHLAQGVRPERIGFISFTKQAVNEARKRAMDQFSLPETSFPNFRTVHSLAFRQLGLKREYVMGPKQYRELCKRLGIEYTGGRSNEDDELYGMSAGDRILFIENLARTLQKDLKTVWSDLNEDIEWLELDRYARALKIYKKAHDMHDFTDMLEMFAASPLAAPELDILIVDEAQDLSALQWDCVDILIAKAKRVYIALDDDQAIFAWSGADVNRALDLPGRTEILAQSYRVPVNLHPLALSISARISRRQAKTWHPKVSDDGTSRGSLNYQNSAEDVDLTNGTWLLLARNGYLLAGLEDMCQDAGWSFTSVGRNPLKSPAIRAILQWEKLRRGQSISVEDAALVARYTDAIPRIVAARFKTYRLEAQVTLSELGTQWTPKTAPIWHEALDRVPRREKEYFIAARRRGESLTKEPRIRISTIHSSKGGQADHVLLVTDMSQRTYRSMERHMDDEHRVWYVGCTRAKDSLHIIQPQTQYAASDIV
jgi:superfamily I DNA/RNA helicase